MSVPKVTSPSEKVQAAPRAGVAMAVIMTGVLMTAVDTTIVVLALPEIQRGLHVDLSAVVWVIISFLLVITLLATQVGRLGDMFGRVRMYETGFAVFVLGSLACALAWNEPSIIAFRVLQGVGGAFIMANSGAVIADLYPRELRGKAYGYTSVGWTMGAIIGIVLGGVIVTYISWRWIFWINVPVGVAAAALSLVKLPESRGPVSRLDLPGVPLVAGAAVALTWGLIQVGDTGWTGAKTVTMLIVGVVLLAAFVVREQRAAAPMLPLRLFRSVPFAAANGAAFMMNAAIMAAAFLTVQYFQLGIGYGPMATGLRLLPWTATPMVIAPLAGILADRIGTRPLLATGLLLQAAGLAWVAGIASAGGGYARFVLPLMIAGVGISMSIPTVTAAALGAVEPADIGRASGVVNTLQRFGGAFGIAIATAVFSAHGHLGSAASVTSGYRPALAVAAGLSLIGGIVALAIRQRPARKSWPSHEPVPAAEALQPATR